MREQYEALLIDEQFRTVAFLAKSLSDENRLRIMLCISKGKKSTGSIVEEVGLSQPLVSQILFPKIFLPQGKPYTIPTPRAMDKARSMIPTIF